MASDGLFTLSKEEIVQHLKHHNTAKEITNNLLEATTNKQRENQDNTSVLIVKIPDNFNNLIKDEETKTNLG